MSNLIIAVHCLIYLNHKNKICSSSELSKNLCIPSSKIRKIMSKIEKANIINNIMGKNGGYILIKNIKEINLYNILQILNSNIIKANWFSGDEDADCIISSNIKSYFTNLVNEANIFLIPFLKNIYLIDIEKKIFKNKEV